MWGKEKIKPIFEIREKLLKVHYLIMTLFLSLVLMFGYQNCGVKTHISGKDLNSSIGSSEDQSISCDVEEGVALLQDDEVGFSNSYINQNDSCQSYKIHVELGSPAEQDVEVEYLVHGGSALNESYDYYNGTFLIPKGAKKSETIMVKLDGALKRGFRVVSLLSVNSNKYKIINNSDLILFHNSARLKFKKISSNLGKSVCGIKENGSILCIGSSINDQLGYQYNYPYIWVQVPDLEAVAVTNELDFSCAILKNGSVSCWGLAVRIALVDGSGELINTMSIPDITGAVAISSSNNKICAVQRNGVVKCWWFIEYGGIRTELLTNVVAADVSLGNAFGCILMKTGRISCWGDNSSGQLGNGTKTSSNNPVLVPGIGDAVGVASGSTHSCALLEDGRVFCWGDNSSGQLGNGTKTSSNNPVLVAGIKGAVQLSLGRKHSCVLLGDGGISCWGSNDSAQMGNGLYAISAVPLRTINVQGVKDIALGNYHTCSLLKNGKVFCWGDNSRGQVGSDFDTHQYRFSPVPVSEITNAVGISLGSSHSCARSSTGGISCWGNNGSGQLGNVTTEIKNYTPVPVLGITNAAEVSLGSEHSCASLSDGRVFCWGNNGLGQLGNGSSVSKSFSPVSVLGITNAIALSSGGAHSCALLSTGEVKCWGRNNEAQLGRAVGGSSNVPIVINGVSAIQISSGGNHNCAVARGESGSVLCWGSGLSGELGTGSLMISNDKPEPVLKITKMTKVSAGVDHTCALNSEGIVFCWGGNRSGQLGQWRRPYLTLPIPMLPLLTLNTN